MAELRTEYRDLKEVMHRVEHLTLPTEDKAHRERIVEDLLHALTKSDRKIPA